MPSKGQLVYKSGWKIEYVNEKNQKKSLNCTPEIFSLGFEPDMNTSTPVYFERAESAPMPPIRVWPQDSEWTERPRPLQTDVRQALRERDDDRGERRRNDDRNRQRQPQPQGGTMPSTDLPREFHNPYNFVPAPKRKTQQEIDKLPNLTDEQKKLAKELCDDKPCGHDRFHPDKYSGKLRVKMTVRTPLLLSDTARMHYDNEHKSYPVRVDAEGKPIISATAVKGMLRSAYEAVTNSRMGVFQGHNDKLAFRMESTEGARSVPARIVLDGASDKEYIELCTGTSLLKDSDGKDGEPKDNHALCAAWLPSYDKSTCRLSTTAVLVQPGNRIPKHKEKLWAWLEEFERYTRKDADRRATQPSQRWKYVRNFKYWRVRYLSEKEFEYDADKLSTSPTTDPRGVLDRTPERSEPPKSLHVPTGKVLIKVRGYVCLTGKNWVDSRVANDYASPNIKNKHDERLFFNLHNGKEDPAYLRIELTPTLREKWKDLIKNYRLEHKKDINRPPNANGNNGDVPLQWSRHIRETSEKELEPAADLRNEALGCDTLCYAGVEWNTGKKAFDVSELFPVGISRRLHQLSPLKLLDNTNLEPAAEIGRLSPADRVFGWVRQGNADGIGAYRGQLRIGAVECKGIKKQDGTFDPAVIQQFGEDKPNTWLPLQILGQPKPQQGRFYVAENKDGKAQGPGLSNEQAGYNRTDKGLRGRKVYPHHAQTTTFGDYWLEKTKPEFNNGSSDLTQSAVGNSNSKFFREYIRPIGKNKTTKQPEQQRDNQNRSIEGWVKPGTEFEFDIHFTNLSDVELGALVWLLSLNNENEDKYFHRFGGGKPLGFGSVKLEIAKDDQRNLVVDIRSGKELIETRYANLNDDSFKRPDLKKEFVDKFEGAVQKAYPHAKFLNAFRNAAEGFGTLPTHYPRTRQQGQPGHPAPNPKGESFKWFVQNSRTAGGVRPGYVLPDLEKEIGLPILAEEENRQQRVNTRSQRQRHGKRGNRNRQRG